MWKSVKLGTLCKLVNGKAFKPSDWSEDGIRIVRIQNLNDLTKHYNHWAGPLDKQVLIDSGNLLLAWSGTPGTSFGAHIWNNGKAILNQHIFRVDLHDGVIDSEWAKMSINYKLNSLIDQAHGGVGLQHVTKPMVEGLVIPLPPLPIQKQIAGILEIADAAREKRQQANQLTERFLQSVFLEMFGDPVTNPKGWERRTLGDVCLDFQNGLGKNKEHYGSGTKVANIGDLYDWHTFEPIKFSLLKVSKEEIETYRLHRNDILFVRSSVKREGVAYCSSYQSDEECLFSSFMIRAIPDQKKVESGFLAFQMRMPPLHRVLVQSSNTSTLTNISQPKIKAVHVILPPLPDQHKFAALVEKVEGLRVKQRESEGELENLFQSLMQRAFRGELVG